jgi:hypothetical protein
MIGIVPGLAGVCKEFEEHLGYEVIGQIAYDLHRAIRENLFQITFHEVFMPQSEIGERTKVTLQRIEKPLIYLNGDDTRPGLQKFRSEHAASRADFQDGVFRGKANGAHDAARVSRFYQKALAKALLRGRLIAMIDVFLQTPNRDKISGMSWKVLAMCAPPS